MKEYSVLLNPSNSRPCLLKEYIFGLDKYLDISDVTDSRFKMSELWRGSFRIFFKFHRDVAN